MSGEPDICQVCGVVIQQALFTQRGPFGIEMQCRQALCVKCSFADYLSRYKLRCPYKAPLYRYTSDGQVPKQFVEGFNAEKQAIVGHIDQGGPAHE